MSTPAHIHLGKPGESRTSFHITHDGYREDVEQLIQELWPEARERSQKLDTPVLRELKLLMNELDHLTRDDAGFGRAYNDFWVTEQGEVLEENGKH